MAARLDERVARNTGRTPTGAAGAGAGAEVERAAPKGLRGQITDMLPEFERAMPKGFEAQQLIRDAFTQIRLIPDLARCTPESVLGGLMTVAQLGLRPGVMGQCWLLPFKSRAKINDQWVDVWNAQIVIGYQGYVELVYRSPGIKKVIGRAVHENDYFYVEYGSTERLEHRPPPRGTPRGAVTDYYAVITFEGGDQIFWTMTREEGLEWRTQFAMATKRTRVRGKLVLVLDDEGRPQGSGPWYEEDGPAGGTGLDAMIIKTCFLRAKRWAPKSVDRLLNAAAAVDGSVRLTYRPESRDDLSDMETAQPVTPADVVIDVDDDPDGVPAGSAGPAAGSGAPGGPAAAGDVSQGKVRQGQLDAISAILTKGGVTVRANVLAVISHIVGAPITTRSALTFEQAAKVLDTLQTWQSGDLTSELQLLLADINRDDDPPAAQPGAPADAPGDTPGDAGGNAPENPGDAGGDNPAGSTTQRKLPNPGTRAWHAGKHPRYEGAEFRTEDRDSTGQCPICQEQGAGS